MKEEEFHAEGPEPLIAEIAPGDPYPVEALGPLRSAVEYVQGRTLAPVAIAAQSALAVASLAVMGHADVETLNGKTPTALYLMTIASSGERKSTCDNMLMQPINAYEKEEALRLAKEYEAWRVRCDIWKVKHTAAITRLKSDEVAATAELRELGPEPEAPVSADRVVKEPTYEGLTRAFKEGYPALGIFSDEGGQFLGGNAMNSENRQKTLAALNDLWQGNPIKRTRQGEGSYTMHGRRLAIHLMVQPSVFDTFLADAQTVDIGFLPRFLITHPPSTIGTRMQADVRESFFGMSEFSSRGLEIMNTKPRMNEKTRELQPRRLALSDGARNALSAFADEVEAQQRPHMPLRTVSGFASKAAEQAARIAGVLTLWGDLAASELTKATMEHAITLMRFYLSEALRLMTKSPASQNINLAEKLRVWLLECWPHDEIVKSEIIQYGPNVLRNTELVQKAVKLLVDHRWLVPLPPGTIIRDHRRACAWRIAGK